MLGSTEQSKLSDILHVNVTIRLTQCQAYLGQAMFVVRLILLNI